MKLKFKNNFIGYFQFYYSVVGNKLLFSVSLSIIVTLLDGVGLTMFMPLLQAVSGKTPTNESLGQLHFITDGLKNMGIPLSLVSVLAILAILFCLKGVFKFLELSYQAVVIQYFMKRVRHELVKNLQRTTYKKFTTLDAGKIQNTFITEVQRMSSAVRSYLSYTQHFFMLATYVLLALLANYQFAILVAISSALTNIIYRRLNTLMKRASLEISQKGHDFNSFMIQGIHYFKYLKSTNYLGTYAKKLDEVIDKTERVNKKTGMYSAVSQGIREPMTILIVVMVIYVQLQWLGGDMSSIILSLLLFYRALTFLLGIQTHWQSFMQNTGAMATVSALSEDLKLDSEKHGDHSFGVLKRDINVENIDMSYGTNKVLNNISISIPRNNTIALVGPSGSGKTTLANIIIGLISPESGKVLIDGIKLSDYDLNNYRSKIGYISQDSVIFNDNIYNNVTFWAERTPENEARFWEVIKMSHLQDFVQTLPNKELTGLGDNGLLVSGGQKQRISIAREMYKKDIEILILDEATSALDSETEHIIQENIENLHGQYTMIVIAHRLSTIKNVDTIYLLENGVLTISGDFNFMIEKSDKFKRMVSLQGM